MYMPKIISKEIMVTLFDISNVLIFSNISCTEEGILFLYYAIPKPKMIILLTIRKTE